MADQLSELLHRSVDDVAVPHPAAYDIIGRGRGLRRRRRVATGVVAAVAVAVAGIGGVVLTDVAGDPDSRRHPDVTGQEHEPTQDADAAYRANGAWVVGDRLTIGQTEVSLAGPASYLAQTSAGVVAQERSGPSRSTFELVRPDGTRSTLSIPASTATVNGDLDAPRVAWVDNGVDELELHVWDVDADREVGHATIAAPGTDPASSGQFLTPAFLDGTQVYVGAADGTGHRVDWRTGTVATIEHAPFSVRHDVLASQAGDRWVFVDPTTGTALGDLDGEIRNPLVSPDGRLAAAVRSTETDDLTGFVTVADGTFTELPELSSAPVWTPGGRLLSITEDGTAVVVCATSGKCEQHDVDGANLVDSAILLADYLNVG